MKLAALLLVTLTPGCSMSLLGDATDNCAAVEALLAQQATRCNRDIVPLNCDELLYYDADPEACGAALEGQVCEDQKVHDQEMPAECKAVSMAAPWR